MSYALPSALHYRRLACSTLVRSASCMYSSPGDASHRWLQVLVPTAFLDRAHIEFSETEVAISVLRRVRDFGEEAVHRAIESVFSEFGNKQFAYDQNAISDVFYATMNSINTDGYLGQPMVVRQATDCASLRAYAAFAYEAQRSVTSSQTGAYDRYANELETKSDATLRRSVGSSVARPQNTEDAVAFAPLASQCTDGQQDYKISQDTTQEFAISDPVQRRRSQVVAGETEAANVLPTVAKAESDMNFARNAQRAEQVAEAQHSSEFNAELCPFAPQITEKAREMTYPEALQRIEDRVQSHIDYRLDLHLKIAKKVTDEKLKECTFTPVINPSQPQYADIYTRRQITSLVNDGNWRAANQRQQPYGSAADQQDAKAKATYDGKAFGADLAETLAGTVLAAE